MISEYTWHSRTRRAMTWVYCEPKSRMRIFECLGGAAVFMDAFAARRVRRPDLPDRGSEGRAVPGRRRRVEIGIERRRHFVARADRRIRQRSACSRSRIGSTRASSAHFRNEARKSKSIRLGYAFVVIDPELLL